MMVRMPSKMAWQRLERIMRAAQDMEPGVPRGKLSADSLARAGEIIDEQEMPRSPEMRLVIDERKQMCSTCEHLKDGGCVLLSWRGCTNCKDRRLRLLHSGMGHPHHACPWNSLVGQGPVLLPQ
jgi:hypothetical protein